MKCVEELKSRLIGIRLQPTEQFCPMRLEWIGTPALARCRIPVGALADHDAAGPSIVTPQSDTTDKGGKLAAVEAPGVLGPQFIK